MQPKRLIEWLETRQKLAPFQKRFIRGAFRPGISKACLSGPRGLGKSSISGEILAAALDPTGPLFVEGGESILLAGSLDQARAVFRFLRDRCDGPDFRYLDSGQRVGVTHKPTHTRVRVASSDSKRAFGLVGARLIVGDEPASWQERGGALMYDALETSGGKNEVTLILIGTKAPGTAGGWWRELISHGHADPGTYVQVHDGPVDTEGRPVDPLKWASIRKANPLIGWNPFLLPKLKEERLKATRGEDAYRRFCSYRLNLPQQDLRTVLLSAEAWKLVKSRAVPEVEDRPVVGLDMGSGRAWCSAVAVWKSGRTEAYAVMPGIPSVADQEQRDGQPSGTYQRLIDGGRLFVAKGRRVPKAGMLLSLAATFIPRVYVCDRWRVDDLRDTKTRVRIIERRNQWSDASHDVRSLREMAEDGPLAVEPGSVSLLQASLSVARVIHDESGNCKIQKSSTNRARDDVAAALALACGTVKKLRPSSKVKVVVGVSA